MRAPSREKICVVTDELTGPDYNGGIGTACHGLATALAAAGFAVDILYTRVANGVVNCHRGSFESQVERFALLGIRLLAIAHQGAWNDFPGKSFAAMNHLQSEAYDLVFFNETHGSAFYPLLSRRSGNPRLARTRFCTVIHSATQWIADINGEPVSGVPSIRLMEMERRSVELSDVVFSPSAYLIEKYKSYGWTFPADTRVQRYVLPIHQRAGRPAAEGPLPVEELVFFGRLERRKGIEVFCGALDRMKHALRGKTVSFLGRDTMANGRHTLERLLARSATWPFEVRVMQDYDRERALDYLQNGHRLAVMPSLEDNSPCVIQECLELGIPFIAASGSGGEELIDPESRADCCFAPSVAALAERLEEVLQAGVSAGRLSFDPAQNERSLVEWVKGYLSRPAALRRDATAAGGAKGRITLLVSGTGGELNGSAVRRFAAVARPHFDEFRTAVIPVSADESHGAGDTPVLSRGLYDAFVAGIGKDQGDLVCIWDAALDNSLDWLLRARDHLLSARDCDAVAGLATVGVHPAMERPPAYVSVASAAPTLRQPIVGACDTLASLSLESNSGFVLMRGAAFGQVRECLPWDPVYARAKQVDDWIDELLSALRARGGTAELIPDIPVAQCASRTHFEVFRRGAARRNALTRRPGHVPGSAAALVARLGVDRAADREWREVTGEFLERAGARTGVAAAEWSSTGGVSNAHLEQVMVAAFATGQVELAKETLAYFTSVKGAQYFDYTSRAERFWDGLADDLSLALLVERQRCELSGHRFQPIFLTENGAKGILLRANHIEDGVGRMAFEVDLTDRPYFQSSIRTMALGSGQVRFYVAVSSGGTRISRESVASGNAPVRFDFELPGELRGPCSVQLMTELRSDDPVTDDANALWINPRFVRAKLA